MRKPKTVPRTRNSSDSTRPRRATHAAAPTAGGHPAPGPPRDAEETPASSPLLGPAPRATRTDSAANRPQLRPHANRSKLSLVSNYIILPSLSPSASGPTALSCTVLQLDGFIFGHPSCAAAAAAPPPNPAEGPPTGLCEEMPDCLKEAMFVAHLHVPLAAWAGGGALMPLALPAAAAPVLEWVLEWVLSSERSRSRARSRITSRSRSRSRSRLGWPAPYSICPWC